MQKTALCNEVKLDGNAYTTFTSDKYFVCQVFSLLASRVNVSTTLKERWRHILNRLSEDSSALFLLGLDKICVNDKQKYVESWVSALERIIEPSCDQWGDVHHLFLERFPWHMISFEPFFQMVQSLCVLKSDPLWGWFRKYFEWISVANVEEKELTKAIIVFQHFLDCCVKYKVVLDISMPPKQVISFETIGENYLKQSIAAIEKFPNKSLQARLLDSLPNERLFELALNAGFDCVCCYMITDRMVRVPTLLELKSITSYPLYCGQALSYASRYAKISFLKCLEFFEMLNSNESERFDMSSNLLLAQAFIESVVSYDSIASHKAFIYWAIEVAERLGICHFRQIFEKISPPVKLDDYITICQFLLDISDLKADMRQVQRVLVDYANDSVNLIDQLVAFKNEAFERRFPQRALSDVLNAFKDKSLSVQFPLSPEEVDRLGNDYREIEEIGKTLMKRSLPALTAEARERGMILRSNPHDRGSKLLLLGIIREVIRYTFKIYPHNTQVLSVLGLLDKSPEKRGRISQIGTGEGKSTIVTMLSTYLACQGNFIDIITSSGYLAVRDQKKYEHFFELFGITTSHIDYVQPEKRHFDGQILYGTNYDFEFSILKDSLYNMGLRYTTMNGVLVKRSCDIVIVDEVDNLFLDTALNSARLAIGSSDSISLVYEPILNFVRYMLQSGQPINDVTQEVIVDIKNYMGQALGRRYIDVAKMISDKQLKQWITSAKRALDLKKDRDYVIKMMPDPMDHEHMIPKVIIVDYQNTGRLNVGSRWQGGQHEFVEVLNNITPEDESMTAASLSHPAFFQYFQTIYGLTGTMGGEEERREIELLYHVDSFDVPSHLPKKRERIGDRYLQNESEHEPAVLESITEMRDRRRPVLILMNTIHQSLRFQQLLCSHHIENQTLNGMQEEDEDYIIARAGRVGMVTVATNMAGRGTDISLTPESKDNGGLHVIFTFYPENVRVEEQGLGRAGRQGQPGTCCIITHAQDTLVKKLLGYRKLSSVNTYADLDARRSKQIRELSQHRVMMSRKDTIQNSVLQLFFELLEFCNLELSNLDLTGFEIVCKNLSFSSAVEEKELDSQNTLPKSLIVEMSNFLKQQFTGTIISWVPFLRRLKKEFLTMVQKKWARFFSKLDDDEDIQLVFSRKYPQYAVSLFEKFKVFFDRELYRYLSKPQEGFLNFIGELTPDCDHAKAVLWTTVSHVTSDTYALWRKKVEKGTELEWQISRWGKEINDTCVDNTSLAESQNIHRSRDGLRLLLSFLAGTRLGHIDEDDDDDDENFNPMKEWGDVKPG